MLYPKFPSDAAGRIKWFKQHAHLKHNDQCQILGIDTCDLRKIKSELGLRQPAKTLYPASMWKSQRLKIPITSEVPPDWRTNKEWLTEMLKHHSRKKLSKHIGIDHAVVGEIVRRLGVEYQSHNGRVHKCKNHKWCHRHYVELMLPVRECAKIAGVSAQTIVNWLNEYKIPLRHNVLKKNLQIWEKELVYKLRRHPLVKKVTIHDDIIFVGYKGKLYEYYVRAGKQPIRSRKKHLHFDINAQHHAVINKIPRVYNQYGMDMFGRIIHPAHICLNMSEMLTASRMEQRLAIHGFIRKFTTRKWIHPTFPEEAIKDSWELIKHARPKDFWFKDTFRSPYGGDELAVKIILMHFFDLHDFRRILRSKRKVAKICNKLFELGQEINTFNLLKMTWKLRLGVRKVHMGSPAIMVAIFKSLKLTGSILDINVGFGVNAIASAAVGLEYFSPDPLLEHALNRGICDFTGAKLSMYDGRDVDTIIYNNYHYPPDMDVLKQYMGRSKRLLVVCREKDFAKMAEYNPVKIIKLRMYRLGYILIW